jgi:Na+-translocating ferredoxin:NAD+ oxidoreductase RnfD subunit
MTPNRRKRVAGWLATILFVVVLAVLGVFLPAVAAVLFVVCATFVAVAVGRSEGFWKGVKQFVKDILFGW